VKIKTDRHYIWYAETRVCLSLSSKALYSYNWIFIVLWRKRIDFCFNTSDVMLTNFIHF